MGEIKTVPMINPETKHTADVHPDMVGSYSSGGYVQNDAVEETDPAKMKKPELQATLDEMGVPFDSAAKVDDLRELLTAALAE